MVQDLNADRTRYQPLLDLIGRLDADQSRAALDIYLGIARRGMVTDDDLRQIIGGRPTVGAWLRETPGVFRDKSGNIIGFWGLTAAPISVHKLTVEGMTRYAWCAWDTLFLPELLGTTVRIESRCARSGSPIILEVSPERILSVSNPGIAVSMLVPDANAFSRNILGTFCHHVHFFNGTREGSAWAAGRTDIDLISLESAYSLGQLKNNQQFGQRGLDKQQTG